MELLAQVHIYCFLLSYLVSLGCEIFQVFRGQSTPARVALLGFTSAGFVAHTAFLLARSQKTGLPPLLTSQQDWLLVLAWLGGLLYLILLISHRQRAQGLFMLPAVLLLVTVSVFVSDQASGNLREIAMRRWGMFHAASLVLGIGAVVGALISGLMYLLHHQRLRSRSAWLQKLALPNLENLTAWNRWMVVFSVPCLTIGLLSGFLLISLSGSLDLANSIPWTDPTILATIAVWFGMVILLIRLLSSSNQTGKSVAQLSLLSGGFLLVTILGLMFLAGSGTLDTFHGRPRKTASFQPQTEARAGGSPDEASSMNGSQEPHQ